MPKQAIIICPAPKQESVGYTIDDYFTTFFWSACRRAANH